MVELVGRPGLDALSGEVLSVFAFFGNFFGNRFGSSIFSSSIWVETDSPS